MYDVADSVRPGQNRISVLLPLCPFSSMEPHGPFPHDHPAKVPNTRLPGYEWGSIIYTATYHTSTFSWNLTLPPLGDLGPFEEGWGTESLCNVDSSSSTVKHLETGSLALCIIICKRSGFVETLERGFTLSVGWIAHCAFAYALCTGL